MKIKKAEQDVNLVKEMLLVRGYDAAISGSWAYFDDREIQFRLARELGKRAPDLDIILTKKIREEEINELQDKVDLSLDFWSLPSRPIVTISFDVFDGPPMPYDERLIQLRNMMSFPVNVLKDDEGRIKKYQEYVSCFNVYFALKDGAKTIEEIFDKIRSKGFLLQANEKPLPETYYRSFSFIPIERGVIMYKNALEKLLKKGVVKEKSGKFRLLSRFIDRVSSVPSSNYSLSRNDRNLLNILNEIYEEE
ncbi:MAG: hypothetical protein OH319_04980 [Candidatus Parvarchaeota archaeon]|nr:hypothetical protein [Candidatus Jingweiarchaeum tengchongense]MCW1297690.1 hypothetical protein [Candidatus Jingweiarchaeum tengchongense]MCW1299701.1 hypothetical protein [Candidatus Jingweiarchaeum tengchongense]MCW1304331.1 hypothetical protein [Candidatus Jingweiarchaeum tengchongense]MCW1305686.1 hypothetical protein [Candidatus Jingweiarchaeum tengchongense]